MTTGSDFGASVRAAGAVIGGIDAKGLSGGDIVTGRIGAAAITVGAGRGDGDFAVGSGLASEGPSANRSPRSSSTAVRAASERDEAAGRASVPGVPKTSLRRADSDDDGVAAGAVAPFIPC